MPINVAHEIKGDVLGDAAYISGQGQGMERRREQDRENSLQQEVNAIRDKARQDANAHFFASLQAQKEAGNREFEFEKQKYEQIPQRQKQLGQIENDLTMDLADRQYSRSQQAELEKISTARDYVSRNADSRYTPQEQQLLLQQIDEAQNGIQPTRKMYDKPWPKQQDSGQVWVDENTGSTLTRDDKGNVRVLVKPESINSFDNHLKVREQITDYASNIYKSLEMSETPITWQDAIKQAQEFYGDLMGNKDTPQVPAGDEETMADTILQNTMSPDTYAAAKTTGLSSKDIYFITQQLSKEADKPKPSDDISKKEWIKKENFNDYNQKFADAVPQGQRQDAYNDDPYLKQNASALADPDYKPASQFAVWQELTDTQRDKAYQKYVSQNKMPLSDRFNMAVSRVISSGDYKNYKDKQSKHNSAILSKEQFNQKCKDDPQFLWNFVKASNKPQTPMVDPQQVEMSRAIGASTKPVFRGL
jgi:hypothetical protein